MLEFLEVGWAAVSAPVDKKGIWGFLKSDLANVKMALIKVHE
jgi:hypothetical protein